MGRPLSLALALVGLARLAACAVNHVAGAHSAQARLQESPSRGRLLAPERARNKDGSDRLRAACTAPCTTARLSCRVGPEDQSARWHGGSARLHGAAARRRAAAEPHLQLLQVLRAVELKGGGLYRGVTLRLILRGGDEQEETCTVVMLYVCMRVRLCVRFYVCVCMYHVCMRVRVYVCLRR